MSAAVSDGVATMLLGTSFGLVEFLDWCEDSWALPEGSRVMETGGFKGKSREVSRGELYEMFETRLGIPQVMCVSEYSMTELSSQAYTGNLW
ncbi:MAG: CoF synthetase, partial [Persicimonas sp.]